MSSGIGLVLSIAKDALAAQQYGIYVTSHNIANVNTPGYSKQTAVFEAKKPAPFGGVLLGRGVDTTEIVRASDQIIENRVMQQKSSLYCYKEMENYMLAMEGLFNENSDTSLSTMLGEFWNLWHDISNDPSGTAERIALYEHSLLVSQQFKSIDSDLLQLNTDLTNAVKAGVGRVNEITAAIANLNNEIAGLEIDASANDLRDQRNVLASELAEYIDMKIFEQSNGAFTIVSAKGVVLVDGNDGYDIELDGSSVKWQGSGGNEVDITDNISKGKLGGWLDMRDEIVAKYKQDLTELASEFIWAVNKQHSQGVGLQLFQSASSVTGTYTTSTNLDNLAYGSATDGYVDYTGTFSLWIGDANGENLQEVIIDLDDAGNPIDENSTLAGLATSINNQIAAAGLAGVTASVSGGALVLTADATHTFGFSDDTSNILAALGINTFFTGSTAGGMGVNSQIGSDKDYIAAAQIDSTTGAFATGDNTNALAIVDLQYTSMSISEWTYDRINGNTEGTSSATIEEYYHSLVGSLGIKGSNISRSRAFNEVMVNELNTIRESISSVSLDEEMTQLMQYQHAFAAAAKLVSVSDEMLQTLLGVK
jgi:flagellar hook-associated protein 1 FlgK